MKLFDNQKNFIRVSDIIEYLFDIGMKNNVITPRLEHAVF